jgi:hypothetical protein
VASPSPLPGLRFAPAERRARLLGAYDVERGRRGDSRSALGAERANVAEDPRNSSVLKVDTQGYELGVLRGAARALDDVVLVEAELSLLPTYEAGPMFEDVVAFLAEHHFSPIASEGVLDDLATGEMLQVDAIFRST